MHDLEKVIKGLECCKPSKYSRTCGICPYREEMNCDYEVYNDALALLKEPKRKKGSWDYGTQCSVCKGTIIPPKDRKIRINFCPWCGADMRDSYEPEWR